MRQRTVEEGAAFNDGWESCIAAIDNLIDSGCAPEPAIETVRATLTRMQAMTFDELWTDPEP
jgi:hypothetical protein